MIVDPGGKKNKKKPRFESRKMVSHQAKDYTENSRNYHYYKDFFSVIYKLTRNIFAKHLMITKMQLTKI